MVINRHVLEVSTIWAYYRLKMWSSLWDWYHYLCFHHHLILFNNIETIAHGAKDSCSSDKTSFLDLSQWTRKFFCLPWVDAKSYDVDLAFLIQKAGKFPSVVRGQLFVSEWSQLSSHQFIIYVRYVGVCVALDYQINTNPFPKNDKEGWFYQLCVNGVYMNKTLELWNTFCWKKNENHSLMTLCLIESVTLCCVTICG